MATNELMIFKKDTDAPGSNRGFIYQYLKTLVLWLKNFKDKKDVSIFCEVEDDIKELSQSDKLIRFTQIKCYSTALNIDSEEIKKSLYNFFVLSIGYNDYEVICQFETNTHVSRNDALIKKWVKFQGNLAADKSVQKECINKTKEILLEIFSKELNIYQKSKEKQIEKIADKFKDTPTNTQLIKEIEKVQNQLEEYQDKAKKMREKIDDEKVLSNFADRITWVFENVKSIHSIDIIKNEANELLRDILETNRNSELYFHRLLSEINFASIKENGEQRILTNSLLDNILNETDAIVEAQIDRRFIDKFNSLELMISEGVSEIKQEVVNSENRLSDKMDGLKEAINSGLYQPMKEITLYSMPPVETEEIQEYIRKEKNDDQNKNNQSKLEGKIRNINGISEPDKQILLITATNARCRYLIYLDKLQFKNLKEEYDVIRELENKVQRICTNAVIEFSYNRDIPPAMFYIKFQRELNDILDKFNETVRIKSIKIEEETVFGQMFHMAAKCYLKWHREG